MKENLFEQSMSELGLSNDDTLVVYGGENCFSAARCWWMLHCFGHENVHILNGGLAKWKKDGNSTDTSKWSNNEGKRKGSYSAVFNDKLVMSYKQVLDNLNSNTQILDARSPERFHGNVKEPREGIRSGHIPRSINVHYSKIVRPEDNATFYSISEIKKAYLDSGVDLDKNSQFITSCGSGVTASVLSFGLHLIGVPLECAPVYDGSWTEWGSRNELPIEKA